MRYPPLRADTPVWARPMSGGIVSLIPFHHGCIGPGYEFVCRATYLKPDGLPPLKVQPGIHVCAVCDKTMDTR